MYNHQIKNLKSIKSHIKTNYTNFTIPRCAINSLQCCSNMTKRSIYYTRPTNRQQ